jgi:WD40 repeat protein/tRNA A-37 threonylcarbamoyl transferase component Bud32
MSAEPRLQDLLARWEEQHAKGQPIPPEELCRDFPQLLEGLRRLIALRRPLDAGWGVSDTLPVQKVAPVIFSSGAVDPLATRDAPSATARITNGPRLPAGSPRWPDVPGYEIVAELGQGGMGIVYKARQNNLGRLVALKMIRSGPLAGSVELARFRAEVEAVAHLQHPNIVQVYEVGEYEGRPYFAMEFVNGQDLHDVLDAKPQPPRQAAAFVETLARTMHVVHQHGIVHRDLKPANILLAFSREPEGSAGGALAAGSLLNEALPKITDFGLAKRLDSVDGPTLTGNIVGTPSYMSPEQAAGKSKRIGPPTDVYALGVILYEMLIGNPPFNAESAWDTIVMVTSADPVPPRRLQPKVPVDLETICLKCLDKDPAKRYSSADALAEDLRRFLAGEPILARPIGVWGRTVKWARRRPALAALVAVSITALLLLFGGGLVYHAQLRRALDENQQQLVRLEVTQGKNLLEEGDWFGALAWFVDALALDKGNPAHEEMHRRRIGTLLRECPQLVRIWFHQGPVWQVQFSPDGRQVLTTSEDHTACIWDAQSGERVTEFTKHPASVCYGSFDRTGQRVVTASVDGTVYIWEANTGRVLTPPLSHRGPLAGAFFSPDGRQVLTASDDKTACLWDASTGRLVRSLSHPNKVKWACFSPDGRRVATACEDGNARVWDAGGAEQPLVTLKHKGPVTDVEFHPKEPLILTASEDDTARLWNAVTGEPVFSPLRHRARVVQASFSPDGRRFITCSDDQTACIWDTASGKLISALRHRSGVNFADFTGPGRRVVTGSDDNAARVWDVHSGEPLTPQLKGHGSVNAVVFDPRGDLIVAASTDGTARCWEVRKLPALPPTDRPDYPDPYDPDAVHKWESPDKVWTAETHRNHELQVRVAATGEEVCPPLEHGSWVLFAAFSPDRTLLVTGSDDNLARVWRLPAGELATQPLRHHGTVRFATFSADGRMILTAGHDQTVRVWDAGSGEPISPPWKFAAAVEEASFAADGSQVSVFGKDRARDTQTWDLRPDNRPYAELRSWVEMRVSSRLDRNRGLLPLEPEQLRQAWQRHGGP